MESNTSQNLFTLHQPKSKSNKNILLLKSIEADSLIKSCIDNNFNVYHTITTKRAIESFTNNFDQDVLYFPIVITALGLQKDGSDYWEELLNLIRSKCQKTFIIIFSLTASNDPCIRVDCFDKGANMVTTCLNSLSDVLIKISKSLNEPENKKNVTCSICGFNNLSEDGYCLHLPLYHINYDADKMKLIKQCPLCNKKPSPNLQVHVYNNHGPVGRGEKQGENQEPCKLYSFALVVVRRKSDGKYLLVQEFAKSGFWLPGGRVDTDEELQLAAIRECKEEAGVDIKLTGILTLQFKHRLGRLRIIFMGEPIDDDQLPKSIPDYESVGASYVDANDIRKLPLRGNEPLIWIDYVEKNGIIHPMSILTEE